MQKSICLWELLKCFGKSKNKIGKERDWLPGGFPQKPQSATGVRNRQLSQGCNMWPSPCDKHTIIDGSSVKTEFVDREVFSHRTNNYSVFFREKHSFI